MTLTFVFAFVTIALAITFCLLCHRVYTSKITLGGFPFALLGMLTSISGGFAVFFTIDKTKGWNPYGWWFSATFAAAVLGGLLGIVIYGVIMNKRKNQ